MMANMLALQRTALLRSHTGCVNTTKWSTDGAFIITGSDDRSIKIWDASRGCDRVCLKHTVKTSHRSNIFGAAFSPVAEHVVLSCAADGSLIRNDVNHAHAQERLRKCVGLMHTFIFDVEQPQVVYTAEDRGVGRISRIDLRTKQVDKIFDTRSLALRKAPSGYRCRPLHTVKALAQSPALGSSQLLVGGKGLCIGLLDLRCVSATASSTGGGGGDNDDDDDDGGPGGGDSDDDTTAACSSAQWPFAQMWGPHYPHPSTGRCAVNPECLRNADVFDSSEISISGLSVSRNGQTVLASYQGDQIYLFDLFSPSPAARCQPVVEPATPCDQYDAVRPGAAAAPVTAVDHGYCLDPDSGCPQVRLAGSPSLFAPPGAKKHPLSPSAVLYVPRTSHFSHSLPPTSLPLTSAVLYVPRTSPAARRAEHARRAHQLRHVP